MSFSYLAKWKVRALDNIRGRWRGERDSSRVHCLEVSLFLLERKRRALHILYQNRALIPDLTNALVKTLISLKCRGVTIALTILGFIRGRGTKKRNLHDQPNSPIGPP